MPKPKTLHIFRAGRQLTKAGDEIEFTEADLAASASAYNPALHRASIVVGHPTTDGPAYGTVERLSLAGRDLEAEPANVDPQFAELVASKRFHTVSAAFYPPDSKRNPVPGVYYLRHVGFLGAEPPALKGLRPPEFAEADDADDFIAFAEVEFGEADATVAGLFRRLREFVIGKFSQADADAVLPNWELGYLEDAARREADELNNNSNSTRPLAFSEPTQANPITPEPTVPTPTTPTAREQELQAQLDAANAQLTATAQAAAQASHARREAEALQFAEGLVADDRLLPAHKQLVATVLVAIEGDAPVEFGEGDDKMPAGTALRELLGALPKHALNGRHIAHKGQAGDLDMGDANAIAARAVEFQESEAKAGRHVSAAMAVQHVSNAA